MRPAAAEAPSARDARLLSEGEQWTAEALTSLREAGFAPPAVACFLRDAFERAGDIRRRRRQLARQARHWSLVGTAGALLAREALASRGGSAPSRRALLVWCALAGAMLEWHLGMVEEVAGPPRSRLSLADALTIGRGALAPFAASAPPDGSRFLLLLGLAGASDLLDGRLARRAGPTRFGRDFDTIADLAFRAAAIRGASRAGWIPRPAVRALLSRQLLLSSGAAWHWFAHACRPPLDTTRLARWDAPPLLAGLALGARGQSTAAGVLVTLAAVVGTAGLARAALPARAGTGSLMSFAGTLLRAGWTSAAPARVTAGTAAPRSPGPGGRGRRRR